MDQFHPQETTQLNTPQTPNPVVPPPPVVPMGAIEPQAAPATPLVQRATPTPAPEPAIPQPTAPTQSTEEHSFVPIAETQEAQGNPELTKLVEQAAANPLGRILEAEVDLERPKIVRIISGFFFVITFVYTSFSLLIFGVIIALSIALSNVGAPDFLFLRYYPGMGMVPIVTCVAAVFFFYLAYKIQDGSRASWLLAALALLILPVGSSIGLPIVLSPLVSIVSVYAGSPQKNSVFQTLNIQSIGQFFSILLFFEIVLFLLILFFRAFQYKSKPLTTVAKTALIAFLCLFFVPIYSVMAYGYLKSYTTDYDYSNASSSVPFHLYRVREIPGKRILSTKFLLNEELAFQFNAVKATYDVPLPTVVQTGNTSPITVVQTKAEQGFNLKKYLEDFENTTTFTSVYVSIAQGEEGYAIDKGFTRELWFVTYDSVLVKLSSPKAAISELEDAAGLMY